MPPASDCRRCAASGAMGNAQFFLVSIRLFRFRSTLQAQTFRL
jgi:hypothetical protein